VTIGHPGQNVQTQIVTGSTDTYMFSPTATWCLKSSNCPSAILNSSQSLSYATTGPAFKLDHFGGWSADGSYYTDNVQIGDATIEKVQMGLAYNAKAGPRVNNAVLGLGWPNQEAICTSDACASYPTSLDDQVTQGIIASRTFQPLAKRHQRTIWHNTLRWR